MLPNLQECKKLVFSRLDMLPINYYKDACKDEGVFYDFILKFNRHMKTILSKSKLPLVFMKKWCKQFDYLYLTNRMYMALVWPTLEYASVT